MTWVEVGAELAGCLETRPPVLKGADRVDHVRVAVKMRRPSALRAISIMAITLLR